MSQQARQDRQRALGAAAARHEAPEELELPALPERATLADILTLRLHVPSHGLPFAVAPHCVQSATHALKAGHDDEIVLACLLHDIGMAVARPDHGWWGAQLIEPYVSEKVAWAVRYHGALRFYPDLEVGYQYPELYKALFGPDYQPLPHIEAAYRYAREHRWYMVARTITLYEEYSFEPDVQWDVSPLLDVIGRHFRQPAEGLGNDNTPASHMWRTIMSPERPL